MRLPDIDPAGSPRVAMNAPRVDHNPYVPRMGVPAKRYAGIPPAGSVAAPSPRAQHTKTVPPGAGGGHQDFDQAGPYQPHMPSGSQSARTHAEEQNARSKSASASLGTTPRQQQLNAQKDAHEAQQARKRLGLNDMLRPPYENIRCAAQLERHKSWLRIFTARLAILLRRGWTGQSVVRELVEAEVAVMPVTPHCKC